MHRPLIVLAAALAPLTPAIAQTAPTRAPAYVAEAGASDLYEITSSELAQRRARSGEVRDFARMMIDHHRKTTRDVTAAARASGLRPLPPKMNPMQQRMVARLRPLQGAAFEREYLTQQRQAHDMALQLHQGYASAGDRPPLRTVAQSAVPIVQSHIDRLGTIAAR